MTFILTFFMFRRPAVAGVFTSNNMGGEHLLFRRPAVAGVFTSNNMAESICYSTVPPSRRCWCFHQHAQRVSIIPPSHRCWCHHQQQYGGEHLLFRRPAVAGVFTRNNMGSEYLLFRRPAVAGVFTSNNMGSVHDCWIIKPIKS